MVIPGLKPSFPTKSNNSIKFLCSYGGKIIPRYPDGKLRYNGGHTRVLAVNRSVTFSELSLKMGELCGTSVILRCQLPTEDLDALVSIKSDEDLVNLIEEYDRISSSSPMKVRAFLSPIGSSKSTTTSLSPPSSMKSNSPKSLSPKSLSPSSSFSAAGSSPRFVPPVMARIRGFNWQSISYGKRFFVWIHYVNGQRWLFTIHAYMSIYVNSAKLYSGDLMGSMPKVPIYGCFHGVGKKFNRSRYSWYRIINLVGIGSVFFVDLKFRKYWKILSPNYRG